MTAYFVTATGTDIGKTFVTAGLIRVRRARGHAVAAFKPVVSGFDMETAAASDPGVLLAALGRRPTEDAIADISPWRFAAALSPDMAARRENRTVDFDRLVEFCRARIAAAAGTLLIEGVGGVMAPLDDRHTVLDWMAALDLPVLLVAGSYLGTISHSLTALDVLARRRLAVTSLVVSETPGSPVDLDETIASLRRFAPSQHIVALPRLAGDAAGHVTFTGLADRL